MKEPLWDDLRVVLAVARSRSAAGAARNMGIAHATVLRRIQAIEESYGVRIFDRSPAGYSLTDDGRELAEIAERFEEAFKAARRRFDGRTDEMKGDLRFTTTDSLMSPWVVDLLAAFRTKHPDISLSAEITNCVLEMERDGFHVSIGPNASPPASLVGMRLCRMDFGLYVSSTIPAKGNPDWWREMDFLHPDEQLGQVPIGRWLEQLAVRSKIKSRANSFLALATMAEAGMGIAALPCFIGRQLTLTELEIAPIEYSNELWILTHSDLRRSARVRSFMHHMASGIRAKRALFQANPKK